MKHENGFYFYRDYVTEKLFSRLDLNVVPIVFGRRNYLNAELPKNSVIFADDFCSAKALASYLLYLDRNHTAYGEYFGWKRKFRVNFSIFLHVLIWVYFLNLFSIYWWKFFHLQNGREYFCAEKHKARCGFCGLCRELHKIDRPVRILQNVDDWWDKQAHCDQGELMQKLIKNQQDDFCYSETHWPQLWYGIWWSGDVKRFFR